MKSRVVKAHERNIKCNVSFKKIRKHKKKKKKKVKAKEEKSIGVRWNQPVSRPDQLWKWRLSSIPYRTRDSTRSFWFNETKGLSRPPRLPFTFAYSIQGIVSVCVCVSLYFFFSSSSSFVLVARRLLFKQSFRGETPNLYSSSSFKKKIVSFFFKKKFKAPDWKGKPTNAPDSKSFSKSQDFTLVPRNIILRDDNLLRESPTRWNLFPWFSLSPGSYLIIFDLFFSLFFFVRAESWMVSGVDSPGNVSRQRQIRGKQTLTRLEW